MMTNLEGNTQLEVARLYSLRTWIEYGFKPVKNELGWTDYRLVNYASIERWWELVFSAYLLVSIHAKRFQILANDENLSPSSPLTACPRLISRFQQHPCWEKGINWKSALNNLRLIIQPYIFHRLLRPWLEILKIPGIQQGFSKLIDLMNEFPTFLTSPRTTDWVAA